jgi:uncharacterized protein (DUF2147 family)
MIRLTSLARTVLMLPAIFIAAAVVSAGGDSPIGIWMDDTGQGAVEIPDCSGKLCGRVVWLKSGCAGEKVGQWSGGVVLSRGGVKPGHWLG